ncbi:hypothetical protein PSPO01_06613 [Paraphaeosphaeria sporulosa]
MDFIWAQFVISVWYFILLGCIAGAQVPSQYDTLKGFGCGAIALTACFDHRPAFAIATLLGYFLYDAWKNKEDDPENAKGSPNGFAVPNTDWDDEDDSDGSEVSIVVAHVEAPSVNAGDLLEKVQELNKSNEALLAANDRMAKERDQLETDNKRLSGLNFDLNSCVKLYKSGQTLKNVTKRVEEAEQRLADVNKEKRHLRGEIAHLETVVEKYRELQGEAEERQKQLEEQINFFCRTDQSTEAKLNSLDIMVKTLHELASRGGQITDATVFVMNELVRVNIPATHLQIDLGKFAYYVKHVGLQWSKAGSIAGGFRASMSTYFGGDSRTNVVFIHHGGNQEVLPTRSAHNRQEFDHVCKDIEAEYLSSANIVFSNSMAGPGSSGLVYDTSYSSPVATASASQISQPPAIVSGSLPPLAGIHSTALANQGSMSTTQIQKRTDEFFRKDIQSDNKKEAIAAAKNAASFSSGNTKQSANSDRGISIDGAPAGKQNPFQKAFAELAQQKAQTAAPAPASDPFANPFDKSMSRANALPQNRGSGMSFSIPTAPPSGGSRSLARGSARDADSFDML